MSTSTTFDNAFVKQYDGNIQMLYSLRGGIFADKCMSDTINGEEKYYDQLGSVYAEERTNAFGDSPAMDITHDRRRLIASAYHVGLALDSVEKVQTLINPESDYLQRHIQALRRKSDIEFFKGALGTAYSGKAGTVANAITGCPAVAVAEGDTGSTGMNLEKLQASRYQLELANAIDFDDPSEELFFVWSPQQKRELLTSTEVQSSDYTNVQNLVNGNITEFYGFKFITTNMLPYINTAGTGVNLDFSATDTPVDTDTTGVRACFAYAKSNIVQATNPEIETHVDPARADKSFNWYSYSMLRTGALRKQEEGLVVVPCDQA